MSLPDRSLRATDKTIWEVNRELVTAPCGSVLEEMELPLSGFFEVTDTPDPTAALVSVAIPATHPVAEVCAKRHATAVIINTTSKAIGLHRKTADHIC
jgi:hypothetical protein